MKKNLVIFGLLTVSFLDGMDKVPRMTRPRSQTSPQSMRVDITKAQKTSPQVQRLTEQRDWQKAVDAAEQGKAPYNSQNVREQEQRKRLRSNEKAFRKSQSDRNIVVTTS